MKSGALAAGHPVLAGAPALRSLHTILRVLVREALVICKTVLCFGGCTYHISPF